MCTQLFRSIFHHEEYLYLKYLSSINLDNFFYRMRVRRYSYSVIRRIRTTYKPIWTPDVLPNINSKEVRHARKTVIFPVENIYLSWTGLWRHWPSLKTSVENSSVRLEESSLHHKNHFAIKLIVILKDLLTLFKTKRLRFDIG